MKALCRFIAIIDDSPEGIESNAPRLTIFHGPQRLRLFARILLVGYPFDLQISEMPGGSVVSKVDGLDAGFGPACADIYVLLHDLKSIDRRR